MNKRNQHLAGVSLTDVANAFTDPNKAFQFPIKPIQYEMSQRDIAILGGTLGLIGFGLLYLAYVEHQRLRLEY